MRLEMLLSRNTRVGIPPETPEKREIPLAPPLTVPDQESTPSLPVTTPEKVPVPAGR